MKKKLKIVLIANTSNFFNVFMTNHINSLSKKYDLYLCCSDAYKLKNLISKKVFLININYKRGLSIVDDIKAFLVTLYLILKIKPDLSISFTPKIGLIASIVSFILRTPVNIHWYTGQIWATRRGFSKIFFRLIDKLIFILSDYVLIDGHAQRKFLIKEKIVNKNKSIVFHKGSVGGVDISRFKYNKNIKIKLRKKFNISNKTFVFLYLGRINKEKGIIELLDAFKQIQENRDILLIFVGPVEDKILSSQINKNKKTLHFNFTKKPEDWFSLSDILCLPSHREGFGTVVIEAAACGIPSLCSNIYGLQDAVINNKTGFIHKVSNISDIKKKMLYILRNKNLVKEFGSSAKKRTSKEFEQSIVTKKFIKFIDSVIN